MSAFGFSLDSANNYVAGIKYWSVRHPSDTASGYYGSFYVSDGSVKTEAITKLSGDLNPRASGVKFTATGRWMQTDKTAILKNLDLLTSSQICHLITMVSGKTFSSGSSNEYPMGIKWKLVIPKNPEENRYIEVTAQRDLLLSQLATVIGTPPTPAGDPGDLLLLFNAATIYPGGFTLAEIRNVGETNWEVLGDFTGASLEAELVTNESGQKTLAPAPFVKINIEIDMMQTADELALMPTVSGASSLDFRLTAFDGTLFTFADNLGLDWTYDATGNADKMAMITLKASGLITTTAFDSAIS